MVQLLHKRSATPGATPAVTALAPAEFAVNTHDGEVFFVGLIDPLGANTAENKFVIAVTRPPRADGGVIEITGITYWRAEAFDATYHWST